MNTNNHRIDSIKENAIPVDKHSSEPGLDFTKHARITHIEKIENTRMTKQELTLTLGKREDLWTKSQLCHFSVHHRTKFD